MDLILNQTGNTQTEGVQLRSSRYSVFVWGNFNGATVRLESAPIDEDGNALHWFSIPELTFAGEAQANYDLGVGTKVRAVVSGAGASTDVSLSMREILNNAVSF